MKKIIVLIYFLILFTGCGKYNKEDIVKDFKERVNDSKSYVLMGKLEIYRNEDLYTYDVTSSYKNKNNFKVDLINTTNNHEQIILRNNDEVYVVTPSLNKSFKFQSEWPYNNSQIYLLQPIVNDLEADENVTLKDNDNGYILTIKANYINDKTLVKQKVYLDKKLNLKKVEVIDDNDDVVMRFKIVKTEFNIKLDDDDFKIANYITLEKKQNDNASKKDQDNNAKNDEENNQENNKNANVMDENETNNMSGSDNSRNLNSDDNSSNIESQTTSNLNEVLYPMYVPVDTYLKTQDVLALDEGSRTILTFAGESPFTLVQSSLSSVDNKNVYGDPYLIADTVGAISDYSLSWISNQQEYYLTSNTMDLDELLLVAQSLSVTEVGK